jgi:hypothetical protein
MEDVTYRQFICMVRPEKAGFNQIQSTVGGDRINYPGKVATPTTETPLAKMLFNSVVSTKAKGARFMTMTMNISNFYLMTTLYCPEFIQIKLSDIPNEVVEEYKLKHNSQVRHVRPTTSRAISQQTPQQTSKQTRLPTKQIGTWRLKT